MVDWDQVCGHWLYNRPYVWLPGKSYEDGQRLYLVHPDDEIYSYTREGKHMSERRVVAGRYRYVPSISIEESRGHTSKLDLWAHPERIKRCQWVPRYFRVYVADRDGPLDKLEVRKNGVKFGPKSGRAVTLEEYMYRAVKEPGDTDFIMKPIPEVVK